MPCLRNFVFIVKNTKHLLVARSSLVWVQRDALLIIIMQSAIYT
jgi:hypothetical protein